MVSGKYSSPPGSMIMATSLFMYNQVEFGGLMDISWYGHSCFRLTERGMASVVIDPFDHTVIGYEPLKLKADILIISHDLPGHNYAQVVKGVSHTINGPGEYEIGGVFITGVQTNGNSKKNENEPRNTLYLIDYNGITVLHLGGINRIPSQTEVEDLGPIKIAMVPVGAGSSLNAAKAAEVVSLLEPSIVIPMHYATPQGSTNLEPLGKFLKEMGISQVDTMPKLEVKSKTSLPEETKVVVLDYPHG
jgi:L-ascorbate metabolism protein UlaG (beta-lactamase superfamily)